MSHDEQRRALLDEFLERDTVKPEIHASLQEPNKASRVPTQSEIDEILKPLRPHAIRKIAQHHNIGSGDAGSFIFLRTHHGPHVAEEERILNDWLSDDGLGKPCIGIFIDGGKYWMMPSTSTWDVTGGVSTEPSQSWLFPLTTVRLSLSGRWRSKKASLLKRCLHMTSCLSIPVIPGAGAVMIIFDAEFFETNKAGLAFGDSKGDAIRASRVAKGEIEMLDTSLTIKANLGEQKWWTEGVTEDKYRSMIAEQ